MKYTSKVLLISTLLLSTPVLAQEDLQQQPPPTVILPTPLVLQIRRILGAMPYDQSNRIIAALEGCYNIQMPGSHVIQPGMCPGLESGMRDATGHPFAGPEPHKVPTAVNPKTPDPVQHVEGSKNQDTTPGQEQGKQQ